MDVMRLLTWVMLIVTGVLALGFLLLFIDMVATGLTTGAIYRYVDMAEVLALFLSTAYISTRSLRSIQRPRPSIQPVA